MHQAGPKSAVLAMAGEVFRHWLDHDDLYLTLTTVTWPWQPLLDLSPDLIMQQEAVGERIKTLTWPWWLLLNLDDLDLTLMTLTWPWQPLLNQSWPYHATGGGGGKYADIDLTLTTFTWPWWPLLDLDDFYLTFPDLIRQQEAAEESVKTLTWTWRPILDPSWPFHATWIGGVKS